jgi:hypothetical protein
MAEPWSNDPLKWRDTPLIEKLKILRRRHCCGIFGGGSPPAATQALDLALREAITALQDKEGSDG